MKVLTNLFVVTSLIVLLSGGAHAGGVKLRVNKDFISVSPPKKAGIVFVTGLPRSAMGVRPIRVAVRNKSTDITRADMVHKNGSFSIAIKGCTGDKLYVTFVAANSKKDTVKFKVPPRP